MITLRNLSWLWLGVILIICYLILYLLSHHLIHIYTSTHCTVSCIVLSNKVTTLLTVSRLKASVSRHSCCCWWRLLLNMHLILKSGILVGVRILPSPIVLSLIMVSVVVWIILNIAILLVWGMTNSSSIVLVLTLVTTSNTSLMIGILVIRLSSLVLVLRTLILSTTRWYFLTTHSPWGTSNRIVQILTLLFFVNINLLLPSLVLLVHELTSVILWE